MARKPRSSARRVADAEDPPEIYGWQKDPGDALPPDPAPELHTMPDLTISPLAMRIDVPRPDPQPYPLGTPEFRWWAAAEALARGAALWRPLLPAGTTWEPGEPLLAILDEGEDFNAYYDRRALNFFHGTADGRTVYSGESPDVVCHEQGHAVLDALRPELFDAMSIEVAAFHESFADMAAILAALQLQTLRGAILVETGANLARNSRLSRMAIQLGWAIRQHFPDAVDPDCLRNAVNSFFYQSPDQLPTSGPASVLSSEPHSFSRVFSGAFIVALAGMLKIVSDDPGDADLLKVSQDMAALLAQAVQAAPVVPEYFSQVAAALIQADAAQGGHYRDALKSAFVQRGVLSPQATVSLMSFVRAAALAPTGPMAVAGRAPARPAGGRGLARMAISGARYGLGDVPLFVMIAAEPRRFAAAAAAVEGGSLPTSSSERAALAFVEDLMQRGHIDHGDHGDPDARIAHPHVFKTHRLLEEDGALVLRRLLFDCGACHM